MTEDGRLEKVTGVLARTFGNTISPVVSLLMGAAGIVTGNPELAGYAIPASALAGALGEEVLLNARRAWLAEGVQMFADDVEAETGQPLDETLTNIEPDRPLRMLLGEAVRESSVTSDEWKVRTFAKAFVAGMADQTKVDEMRLLVAVLRDLTVADARALAAANKTWEQRKSNSREFARDERDHVVMARLDPGLEAALPLLLEKLGDKRLVYIENSGGRVRPTQTGMTILGFLIELGSMPDSPQDD